jgi:hypothetical protein
MSEQKKFSRRYATAEAHLAAQAAKEEKVSEWEATMKRNERARAKRTDREQLDLVYTRRGESKKEKARLLARMERTK